MTASTNSSFNLNKFYQDLSAIESSLTKSGQKRNHSTKASFSKQLHQSNTHFQKNQKENKDNQKLDEKSLVFSNKKKQLKIIANSQLERFSNKEQQSSLRDIDFQLKVNESRDFEDIRGFTDINYKTSEWQKSLEPKQELKINISLPQKQKKQRNPSESYYQDKLKQTQKVELFSKIEKQKVNSQEKQQVSIQACELVGEIKRRNKIYNQVCDHIGKSKSSTPQKLNQLFKQHMTFKKIIKQIKKICNSELESNEELLQIIIDSQKNELQ